MREYIKSEMLKLVLGIFVVMLTTVGVFADGGTVQISREEGPFRITVFTASAVVRAGPEDISVLVQDRKTNEPLLNAGVWLSLRRLDLQPATTGEAWVPPCCRMKSTGGLNRLKAGHEAATNKLLYAVTATLPAAGEWEIKTEVQNGNDTASITGQVRVSPPTPPVLAYWPFFFLPVVSIGGYILHFNLRKRSAKSQDFL